MHINFEIVGALEVVDRLIAMHSETLQQIRAGKRFHKGMRDVTATMHEEISKEIAQCLQARDALQNMSAGNLAHARHLLDQIKEFLPRD